jgi:RHS repeat-associated protein
VSDSPLVATNFAPFGKKTVYAYFSITNDERLAGIWNQNVNGSTLSQFNYAYDSIGNITNWAELASNNTPTVAVMQYDPDNQLLNSTTFSNTVAGMVLKQNAYSYDLVGNRTSEQIGTTAGAPVAISESGYDSDNQVTNRISNSGPVMFAGNISRAGTVSVAGSSATMFQSSNFVAYANAIAGTNVVPIVATDYGGHSGTNDYLVIVTNNGVAENIQYDANGNMTNLVTATSTNSYQWDAANRLVAITQLTLTNAQASLFTYDGLGRRIQDIEATNGVAYVTNKFIWDGQALIEQRGNAGTNLIRRFFGQGEQIAGTNYYFTTDHLGSIREVVNNSGVVQSRYDYDPFGRRVLITGSTVEDFGYAGMYYHSISSLSLTLYREYSADLGRWLSRDPLSEEGGLNLYAYVANNPVAAFDLLGLCTTWEAFGNGLNNTVTAIGDSMGLGLYDLATDDWSQDQGQWDQIDNEMYSTDTPENPAATPYVEGALAVSAVAAATAGVAGVAAETTAPAITQLGENDVVVGMMQDGQVLKQVPYPENPMLAPSHEQIAQQIGVWQGPGQLSEGVEAFTVWNENGQIMIRGSGNFNPTVSPATQSALQQIFQPK